MAQGLKGIKTIRDFELAGKVVFLRLDLNVPLDGSKITGNQITDDTRIRESVPTIKYAIEKGAKLVLASHLGRPKASGDKKYSLEPVAQDLQDKLGVEVMLVSEPSSDAPKMLLKNMKANQVILLENLRYDEGETKNSDELAKVWASYCDIYINDAFGASHRAHASIDALPRLMKDKGIGLLVEKEVNVLDQLMQNPKRPYVAVMGGAKVSDKIGVIEKLIDVVDVLIIGGAMAYTFLKAKGHGVGKSLVEGEKLNYCREMFGRIEARDKTFLLPVDHVVANQFNDIRGETILNVTIPDDKMALDIGPKTIELFSKAISEAGTIFWNGPMGVFESEAFSKGSFSIAKAIAESQGDKIVGGGDSAACAHMSGYADKMTHISTGGGASLEYLQGDRLPGLEAVRQKIRS